MALPQTIHASAIVLDTLGVLVRGPSGAGKSRLCHSLIRQFERANHFAIWVSDDRTILKHHGPRTLASCPHPLFGLAEKRFSGIETVDYHSKCVVDLVVDLVNENTLDRLPESKNVILIESRHQIPAIYVPANDILHAVELVFDHVTKMHPLA